MNRWVRTGLAAALFGWMGGFIAAPTVSGAAVKTARLASVQAKRAQAQAYWDRYYTQALGNQSMRVKGLNALKVLRVNSDGTLPQTPMVAYLQWRWSLNPKRFTRYHQTLSGWIVRDRIVRSLPVPPSNPTPGGVNPPPPIPEPSTMMVGALCAASALIARRFVGRRALSVS